MKGFAIHNAPTNHGGIIPSPQMRSSQMGVPFVRAGDGHFSPSCKCWSVVQRSHGHIIFDGKPVATGLINILNKIILGIIVFVFSSQSFSMSRQYRGGDVSILIKKNEPCFYIENMKLTGKYYITLFEDKTIKTLGEFTSNFQKKYPQKESCILSSSFSNVIYQEDKPYLIVISVDNGMSFGTSFCVVEKNGSKEIQDFVGRCEYKAESLLKRILKFFRMN